MAFSRNLLRATRRVQSTPLARNQSSRQFSLTSYPTTNITTLPNGLRVASEEGVGETATVGVWIGTGSRYENEKTNGVAHFLEHMFFKGTTQRTRQALEIEIENMGGHLNAYTSREQTVFYANVPKESVGQTMNILSDILQNSLYTEESIEREREVILREMQEVEGQMEEVIFDRLHETAYRGCALGKTILGPVENIRSLSRADIEEYISTHYVAPKMVVCGAGAVKHADLVNLSTELFGNVPTKGPKEPYMEPARFVGSSLTIREDSMPLAHLAYAFPTAGWTDSDTFALLLIQTMLGSWDKSSPGGMHSSSGLISEIASKGLAESITTFNTNYSDTGLFGVYAVAQATDLQDLMYNITYYLTSLCYHMDDAKMDEAKNQLKKNMLSVNDGSTAICEDIGRQVLTYGRRMHPTEVVARIDALDGEAVKAAANRYLYDRDFAMSAIGPIHELPDYNWMRRRTYWIRY